MTLAALLALCIVAAGVISAVVVRFLRDRRDDALAAFYERLEARNASSEAYDPWLADLDAAGPDAPQ